mgnify:CR=1 FL=1
MITIKIMGEGACIDGDNNGVVKRDLLAALIKAVENAIRFDNDSWNITQYVAPCDFVVEVSVE